MVLLTVMCVLDPLLFLKRVDGKWSVSEAAKQCLSAIKKPVSVVAIAGAYRQGKSYMMNCLMGEANKFSVAHTLGGHTRGIWLAGLVLL
jgi:hypothetical protein